MNVRDDENSNCISSKDPQLLQFKVNKTSHMQCLSKKQVLFFMHCALSSLDEPNNQRTSSFLVVFYTHPTGSVISRRANEHTR